MKSLAGKVAVVTGAGSGIGLAMTERFLSEGMSVVMADIDLGALQSVADSLRDNYGSDVVLPMHCDVTDFNSVQNVSDHSFDAFGTVHILCNNAGVGAGAEGQIWDHTENDWAWGLAVNLWGVINGVRAFVPKMIENGDGHVVNTSSGNGGVAPLANTGIYATTKAAVVTYTEVLWAQLHKQGTKLSASVLFPGPKMLRTGLFGSSAKRPDRWANDRPRATPFTTIESFEARMRDAGIEPEYTPVEAVASDVVEGILTDKFWILPASHNTDARIQKRSTSMLNRTNPDYID